MIRLRYTLLPTWPPLAWLARCLRGESFIDVYHGSRVEVTDEFFTESIWAGNYEEGGFDQTDIIAGSGGRCRGSRILFVSSGSTVDRLHSIETREAAWVSNSFTCLLTAVNASLPSNYGGYFRDFESIIRGLAAYQRSFHTSAGQMILTYFDNVVWDRQSLSIEAKPALARNVSGFSEYRSFLDSSLAQATTNRRSPSRRHALGIRSTASSGYDSTTVTALVRQYGCEEVICFDRARGGDPDSGAAVVRTLGMKPLILQRDAWSNSLFPEALFLSSDSKGEDVYFKSAEPHVTGTVVFTGFAGGKMWKKRPVDLTENIIREDQSGLSLTEYRLHAGFIHCALPFWGIRQVRDVNRMSNLPEMEPWDFPMTYSKPFCRRVLEEAGIPRDLFGLHNRAASVLLWKNDSFMTRDSMKDYVAWLRRQGGDVPLLAKCPPAAGVFLDAMLCGGLYRFEAACAELLNSVSRVRGGWRIERLRLLQKLACMPDNPLFLRQYVFPWAVNRVKTSYELNPGPWKLSK
jgi:hypothetical protein